VRTLKAAHYFSQNKSGSEFSEPRFFFVLKKKKIGGGFYNPGGFIFYPQFFFRVC